MERATIIIVALLFLLAGNLYNYNRVSELEERIEELEFQLSTADVRGQVGDSEWMEVTITGPRGDQETRYFLVKKGVKIGLR